MVKIISQVSYFTEKIGQFFTHAIVIQDSLEAIQVFWINNHILNAVRFTPKGTIDKSPHILIINANIVSAAEKCHDALLKYRYSLLIQMLVVAPACSISTTLDVGIALVVNRCNNFFHNRFQRSYCHLLNLIGGSH